MDLWDLVSLLEKLMWKYASALELIILYGFALIHLTFI